MKQVQRSLILASESPRRKQLLLDAGFSFEVIPSKVSEIPDENLNVNDRILDIARRKARTIFTELKSSLKNDFIVLAADTEVVFSGKTLGKPLNVEDAYRILRLLSGQSHEVKTAVCVIDSVTGFELSHLETTRIYFKALSDQEIWDYIGTGEPMDKAGAYGIQGIGRKLVNKFEGSFDNVVGLPVHAVHELLAKLQ